MFPQKYWKFYFSLSIVLLKENLAQSLTPIYVGGNLKRLLESLGNQTITHLFISSQSNYHAVIHTHLLESVFLLNGGCPSVGSKEQSLAKT